MLFFSLDNERRFNTKREIMVHVRSWLKDAPIGLRSGSASCHDNDQAGDKFHVSKETKIEIKIRTKKIRAFIRFDRKMRKKYIVPSRTRIMIALAAASLMKLIPQEPHQIKALIMP